MAKLVYLHTIQIFKRFHRLSNLTSNTFYKYVLNVYGLAVKTGSIAFAEVSSALSRIDVRKGIRLMKINKTVI